MKNDLIYSVVLILIAVISRLVPHGWNFTALGAVAITAGFIISNRSLVLITILSSLLISDAIIQFHNTMVAVYLAYAMMTVVGAYMAYKKKNVKNVIFTSLIGSFIFFVVSNLGVWFEGQLYPMTILGLTTCFEMALPFFKNELASNLLIAPGLFLGFKAAQKYFSVDSKSSAVSMIM